MRSDAADGCGTEPAPNIRQGAFAARSLYATGSLNRPVRGCHASQASAITRLRPRGYAGHNRLGRPDRPGGALMLRACWGNALRQCSTTALSPRCSAPPLRPCRQARAVIRRRRAESPMMLCHGGDGPQSDVIVLDGGVFPQRWRLLRGGRRRPRGRAREGGGAPPGERLARSRRGGAGPCGEDGFGGRVREDAPGPCAGDGYPPRAAPARAARAPPGVRHHVFGAEIGVAGSTSADGGASARRPGRAALP